MIYYRQFGKALKQEQFDPVIGELLKDAFVKGTNKVEYQDHQKYKISYITQDDLNLIFIFVTGLTDNFDNIKKELYKCKKEFLNLFEDILSHKFDSKTFNVFNPTVDSIHRNLRPKISLIGFSGVGKTTITRLIKAEEIPMQHIPTITGDIATIKIGKLYFHLWDFAGQEQFSYLWNTFIKGSDAVLLITDSSLENVEKSKFFLELIKEQASQAHSAVIGNKQDLPEAMKPDEIEKILGLKTYSMIAKEPKNRDKMIQIIADILEMSAEVSPLLKPLLERDTLIEKATLSLENADFETSASLFEQISDYCIELGDDSLGKEFFEKAQKIKSMLEKMSKSPEITDKSIEISEEKKAEKVPPKEIKEPPVSLSPAELSHKEEVKLEMKQKITPPPSLSVEDFKKPQVSPIPPPPQPSIKAEPVKKPQVPAMPTPPTPSLQEEPVKKPQVPAMPTPPTPSLQEEPVKKPQVPAMPTPSPPSLQEEPVKKPQVPAMPPPPPPSLKEEHIKQPQVPPIPPPPQPSIKVESVKKPQVPPVSPPPIMKINQADKSIKEPLGLEPIPKKDLSPIGEPELKEPPIFDKAFGKAPAPNIDKVTIPSPFKKEGFQEPPEEELILKPNIKTKLDGVDFNPDDFIIKERPKTVINVPEDAKSKLTTSPFDIVTNPPTSPPKPVSPVKLVNEEKPKPPSTSTSPPEIPTKIDIKLPSPTIPPPTPKSAPPSQVNEQLSSHMNQDLEIQQKTELEKSLMDLKLKKANLSKIALDYDMKELTGEITTEELNEKKQKLEKIAANLNAQIKDIEDMLKFS